MSCVSATHQNIFKWLEHLCENNHAKIQYINSLWPNDAVSSWLIFVYIVLGNLCLFSLQIQAIALSSDELLSVEPWTINQLRL